MRYLLKGKNEYGFPVEETIDVEPVGWLEKVRVVLIFLVGHRLAFRLGLTKIQYITGIKHD